VNASCNQLLKIIRCDSGSAGGVLAIGNDEVDPFPSNQSGQGFANDAPSRPANDIPDMQDSH
jgi:hypothetical protein